MLTWVLFLELEQTKLLILGFGNLEKVHSRPEIWSSEYEHSKLVKTVDGYPFETAVAWPPVEFLT